jgi:surfeit locus 1 family protein
MKFGEHQFKFRLVPTLLLAIPVPLLAGLGVWQLDRAEQKREQTQTLQQRERQAPLMLTGMQADASALRYRRIRVQGSFEPDGQFFIENRRYAGRTGFYVITPLRMSGSNIRVLVNRGWLPAPADGALPAAQMPSGNVEVNGVVETPSAPALVLHDGRDATQIWGRRWPYMTIELFAAGVAYPVQPFVILQDPDNTHGFTRDWPRELPKEGMHLGYAIQWFAFALISLGLYLRLSLVRSAATEQRT